MLIAVLLQLARALNTSSYPALVLVCPWPAANGTSHRMPAHIISGTAMLAERGIITGPPCFGSSSQLSSSSFARRGASRGSSTGGGGGAANGFATSTVGMGTGTGVWVWVVNG